MRTLIAGNWKMNGTMASLAEAHAIAAAATKEGPRVAICPPATLIATLAAQLEGGPVQVGGQDCHAEASGAHTGDIAAAQLRDAGATLVILGHSERRQDHGEDDATVRAKVAAAWAAGLTVILCVGETLQEREAGSTLAVVGGQLKGSLPPGGDAANLVIAYEPVWAIGTGRTPSDADIAEVHAFLRADLRRHLGETAAAIPLLYGGSVKPDNAAAILALPDVDGALVGGASLKAADFNRIIAAAPGSAKVPRP